MASMLTFNDLVYIGPSLVCGWTPSNEDGEKINVGTVVGFEIQNGVEFTRLAFAGCKNEFIYPTSQLTKLVGMPKTFSLSN
jgi:hypothetical protein